MKLVRVILTLILALGLVLLLLSSYGLIYLDFFVHYPADSKIAVPFPSISGERRSALIFILSYCFILGAFLTISSLGMFFRKNLARVFFLFGLALMAGLELLEKIWRFSTGLLNLQNLTVLTVYVGFIIILFWYFNRPKTRKLFT